MQTTLSYAALIALSAIAALASVIFGAVASAKPTLLAALPLTLVMFVLLLMDRRKLLMVILVIRAAADIVLEQTRFDVGGYALGVGAVINAFVIVIALLLVLEKPSGLDRRAVTMWIGFIAVALLGVAVSPAKADGIKLCLSILSYFAIFVSAFYVVRSAAGFSVCVRVVLGSSLLVVAYALFEIAMTGGALGGFRLKSTFPHPNILAFYLVLVIAVTFYKLKTTEQPATGALRGALHGYLLLLLALLVLTQTRSAWAACFFFFVAYGVMFERRYLVYLVVAAGIALLLPPVQERLLDLSVGNDADVRYAKLNSFAWRLSIWEYGLSWMEPVRYAFGYGLGAFGYHAHTFFPTAGATSPGAHNVYVQCLFEIGLAGLIAYLTLYARLWKWVRELASTDRLAAFVASALLAAYLIVSASDNMLGYLSFNWYFWFVLGAACSVVTRARAGSVA
jgi:O-antigen ligase